MPDVPFGDLKRQHEQLKSELDMAALRALASGWYILGPEVQAFEMAFAAYCGARHAIGVGNGTDALYLALAALGVGIGDEVITVANASVYSTVTTVRAGATPVYVDVDEQTHTLDPARLEAAITARTKAILPVHLYGRMADLDSILSIAERHGLPVIEDCAQAHGALLDGHRAGSLGVCGCFSFYPTKNLGALGDGGAIVTNDDALATRLRRLREYGWERKYYTSEPGGINSRLDEVQAAMLSIKLAHLDAWNARRQAIAQQYASLLSDTALILPVPAPNGAHVYHLYVVRTPARERLRVALRERGIGTDVHYPQPVYQLPVYTQYAPPGDLPVTEKLTCEIFSLPMYPELTNAEVAAVASAVRHALEDVK